MSDRSVVLMGVGDLFFTAEDAQEPETLLKFVAPTLRTADVVSGQVEGPYTTRPVRTNLRVAVRSQDPNCLLPMIFANFTVATFAGNHTWDAGEPGIEDTIVWLREHGIAVVGGGMNLDEARRPVVIERKGTRLGFLNYNCCGPRDGWAAPDKAGCAYVEIITHYELDHPTAGGPPMIYTWPETHSLEAMVDDIRKLRSLCDVLVVSFHKGTPHQPSKLSEYERPLSHAAIDAGADLIWGGHQHILQGIEVYNGKVIFHGLSNFVTPSSLFALRAVKEPTAAGPNPLLNWEIRRYVLYDVPQPRFQNFFHPDAKYTIIAKCTIDGEKISRVSYLPCLINEQGQPEILKRDKRGQEVFEYMNKITRGVSLNTRYEWEGDEVVIHAD